jgi:hypothetical protein
MIDAGRRGERLLQTHDRCGDAPSPRTHERMLSCLSGSMPVCLSKSKIASCMPLFSTSRSQFVPSVLLLILSADALDNEQAGITYHNRMLCLLVIVHTITGGHEPIESVRIR